MYNEQLEKLIDLALADGELTEKEKQVLFKKAEAEGIDLDEFEMVLEAKLYEKQQQKIKKTETPPVAPKSDKFGDVRKCPACGAIVQSFQTKCSDCGHTFSNIEGNRSMEKLMKMLDEVENQRKETTPASNAVKGLANTMLSHMTMGMANFSDKINNRKKEIIRNFPIPTTKEDIIDFLALAVPNAKKKGNWFTNGLNDNAAAMNKVHNEFVDVWKAKCEQIVMKAKFSMKDDKNTLEEILAYAKELGIK